MFIALVPTAVAIAATDLPEIRTIFVIDLENHNLSQPASNFDAASQILGNATPPYLNSFMTPGNPQAATVSWARNYHNALATASGNNPYIHPSVANYLWQEAGTNIGMGDDRDPCGTTEQMNEMARYKAPPEFAAQNLCELPQQNGMTWKTYAKDIDLAPSHGGNVNLGGTATAEVSS